MNNSKETFKLFQSARVQNAHVQKLQSTSHHIPVLVIFYQRKSTVWTSWIRNLWGFFYVRRICKNPALLTWPVSIDNLLHEGDRPRVALICLEWVVEIKWEWQGTLSQLAGGRYFLLFYKFLHRNGGGSDAVREWMASQQISLHGFSQPTPFLWL